MDHCTHQENCTQHCKGIKNQRPHSSPYLCDHCSNEKQYNKIKKWQCELAKSLTTNSCSKCPKCGNKRKSEEQWETFDKLIQYCCKQQSRDCCSHECGCKHPIPKCDNSRCNKCNPKGYCIMCPAPKPQCVFCCQSIECQKPVDRANLRCEQLRKNQPDCDHTNNQSTCSSTCKICIQCTKPIACPCKRKYQ